MKRLKVTSIIIIFLAFVLLLPKASCKESTFFLTPGEFCIETISARDDDIIGWSYTTHDVPFMVHASTGHDPYLPSGVDSTGISDSGTVTVQGCFLGDLVMFSFRNIDSHNYSGYIDIDIHKVPKIEGYNAIIFIITIVSIISIIIIIKKYELEKSERK